MTNLTADAPTVNRSALSDADRAWWAAQSVDCHTTGPTPVEALRERWVSWTDWTDDRWALTDESAEAMAEQAEADRRIETLGYF